ncbi:MAG: hypothetical protein WDO19_00865 [Bacteroidota bacterium]
MKKLFFLSAILTITIAAFAQDSTSRSRSPKQEKRREKREKINSMIRKDEEGELAYHKQSVFGIQLRTMGYGLLYEIGRMKTTRKTTTYGIELSEIKHPKEDKLPKGTFTFSNPYIYGKINNFYQFKLGIGQQYLLGDKGNRNGVSVSAIYGGGLSLGLLRPYYIEVQDQGGNVQTIKYSQDSALFVGGLIVGGGGLGKGWGEMKLRPGAYAKAGLRFDYGRFNEVVSAIEIGVSLDAYLKEIPIMLFQQDKRLFFQGYVALEFGKRK